MVENTIRAQRPLIGERVFIQGTHGPVTLRVESKEHLNLQRYWLPEATSDGLMVNYRGHKEDLAAAGCFKFSDKRFDRLTDDGHGGVWVQSSKAGPGRRGFLEISYYSFNTAFVLSLPGVREWFPTFLPGMSSKPQLRLVVDNTRREVACG